MTQKKFAGLTPAQRVAWLDRVSPTNSWAPNDDVFCLHCDAVFKAEDVACDEEGDPTCPLCRSSTPLDFDPLPWWREDLTRSAESEDDYESKHEWIGTPITAEPGKPRLLPERGMN
jgi:hypothetical protein